jgi:hypothetical protein
MKNELVKIEESQLETVVKNSGLALIEGEEIKAAYLPFLSRLVEIQSQASKINFETPARIDEEIASRLRKDTVKIRTDAEKLKDEQKRVDLLRGKVKQDSYNLIASSCKLAEEVFYNVEKARELAEKKLKEQLRIERSEKLSPYTENVNTYLLGEMSETQFSELYTSLRASHEQRLEAEKKAEEDRLALIKAEKEEQERIRVENIRLQREAKEKEAELEKERARIRKENEEKERLAEIERQKNAAILKAQQEKADKERVELLAKADQERKEKEELRSKRAEQLRSYIIFIRDYNGMISLPEKEYQKEFADIQIAAKQHYEFEAKENQRKEAERQKQVAKQAEALAMQIAKQKKEVEQKAKAAAEKAAKLAPDKDKLLKFMQEINDLPRPEVLSIEAANIAANANTLLCKVAAYILENANKL